MNETTETITSLRCWVEVNISALHHNANVLRSRTQAGLMAVVKANAYGHGTAHVAGALDGMVAMFGVANLREACEVRAVSKKTPVLILGTVLPCEHEAIAREGFIPVVSSVEEARAMSVYGTVKLHLAIDTGMGRMGVWKDDALATAQAILQMPGVELAGVCSHLSCADSDAAFTLAQLDSFESLAAGIAALSPTPLLLHVENSAATLAFPSHSAGIVRCGLALYGVSPMPEFQHFFRAVLVWKTRVLLVREMEQGRGVSYGRTYLTARKMRIATLAVGYADGYPRALSGSGAAVVIKGVGCPVVGRVTMDQIMVDVSEVAGVIPGDEAVLLGDGIHANELAEKAGTIPWDIFTGIGQRVARLAV